ncbi:hypothetical protein CEUSTIGMA_g12305.t1 [Chlamydomonas eustigma]|uniref:Uncharacterized protein n=1 Tax=Chlamydomonas eustigma TaxID=1157962 RepID=A0A250XP72_9CHLO|nr:hypothetical protein CEUSTIGMA_g12305.t1 [Chlamydomonas eustigma]|eukprot:GAX84884.1 hypothetical protein CEUSTIGMA_g12305.t1 [Chlamydomonas eustigma]
MGTPICQLASSGGLRNPKATLDANCLVPKFYDEPKWGRLLPMEDANHVWPSANCTSWPQYQGVSCDARAKRLSRAGLLFMRTSVFSIMTQQYLGRHELVLSLRA